MTSGYSSPRGFPCCSIFVSLSRVDADTARPGNWRRPRLPRPRTGAPGGMMREALERPLPERVGPDLSCPIGTEHPDRVEVEQRGKNPGARLGGDAARGALRGARVPVERGVARVVDGLPGRTPAPVARAPRAAQAVARGALARAGRSRSGPPSRAWAARRRAAQLRRVAGSRPNACPRRSKVATRQTMAAGLGIAGRGAAGGGVEALDRASQQRHHAGRSRLRRGRARRAGWRRLRDGRSRGSMAPSRSPRRLRPRALRARRSRAGARRPPRRPPRGPAGAAAVPDHRCSAGRTSPRSGELSARLPQPER